MAPVAGWAENQLAKSANSRSTSLPQGAQCDMANPTSWDWNTGRPWCPDWVIRASLRPGLDSSKVSKALRLVLGPSRWVSEAATSSASWRWRSMPAPPTSANPAPKITANLALAAAAWAKAGRESLTRMTARSAGPPGTSPMVG